MSKYTCPQIDKSALIIIDTQNDFTLDGAPSQIMGTLDILPNLSALLKLYRENQLTIIHVIRLYLQDGSNVDICRRQSVEEGNSSVLPKSYGAEIVDVLKPDMKLKLDDKMLLSGEFQQIGENEFVAYKPRWGAFYKTALEEFLKHKGINTIVFAGCNYPNCPRTSIYEASERDFRIILAKDAMSQLYPKGEKEMENIGVNVLHVNDISALLS